MKIGEIIGWIILGLFVLVGTISYFVYSS